MNRSMDMIKELHTALKPMDTVLAKLNVPSREAFLALKPAYFNTLSESAGIDPTLRRVSVLVAMSEGRDPQVNAQTRLILDQLVKKAGPDMMEACPNCGTKALKTFECGQCHFSFIEDFVCPYLSRDGQHGCGKKNEANTCHLFGLEFETCDVFNTK
jgi:hypothetical protein